MHIRSLTLTNIRSYTNQTLSFPNGSVLLSGDIGAGKSTILLAIEFALFGLKRGELSGSSLLRHGKREGSIELSFLIDEKEVFIQRTLKRGKDDIKQESGFLVINGRKKEGSPLELKAEVLALLGYPKELLTKPKDFLYRFTVYTPQEEMKAILFEEQEARLETLRKVFNIEKYKTVIMNAGVLSKELRDQKRVYEAQTADLFEKRKQHDELQVQRQEKIKKERELEPLKEHAIKEMKEQKEKVVIIEEDIKKFYALKKEYSVIESELRNCTSSIEKTLSDIKRIEQETLLLEQEHQTFSPSPSDPTLLDQKRKVLDEGEQRMRELSQSIGNAQASKLLAEKNIKSIISLDSCPLCLQSVSQDHKQNVSMQEEKKISEYSSHMVIHETELREREQLQKSLKEEIEYLRRQQTQLAIYAIKQNVLAGLREKKEVLSKDTIQLQEKNKSWIEKKKVIEQQLSEYGEREQQYSQQKNLLDDAVKKAHQIDLALLSVQKEKENSEMMITLITKEIAQKEKIKEKIIAYTTLHQWVDEFFCNLMITAEKHVMGTIHREFNDRFQQWFSSLIEDDQLAVRLDDQFTPIIEQNGYETALEDLSGGEKTAIALSYRLALNKVINDVISSIKTKDLIILDEPTDGFSSEQLDKVRDVLQQLQMKQIIIVSHESKIESYVDHVVRIQKTDEGSQIGST